MISRRWVLSLLGPGAAFLGLKQPGKADAAIKWEPIDNKVIGVPIGDPYARIGEWTTCERGHRIAQFVKIVKCGQEFDPAALSHWQQRVPEIGEYPVPQCEKCGSEFSTGTHYHFDDGWRVAQGI